MYLYPVLFGQFMCFSFPPTGENGTLQIVNECDLFLQTNLG